MEVLYTSHIVHTYILIFDFHADTESLRKQESAVGVGI